MFNVVSVARKDLHQGLANFFFCRKSVNILGFVDSIVTVTTTHLRHYSAKAAIDDT